jgi:hypothetical protein
VIGAADNPFTLVSGLAAGYWSRIPSIRERVITCINAPRLTMSCDVLHHAATPRNDAATDRALSVNSMV